MTNEFTALGPEPRVGLNRPVDKDWSRIDKLIEDADGIIDVAHELDRVRGHELATDSGTWAVSVRRGRASHGVDPPDRDA